MPNRIRLAATTLFLATAALLPLSTQAWAEDPAASCRQALTTLLPRDLTDLIGKVEVSALGGARCRYSDLALTPSVTLAIHIREVDVDFGDFGALRPQTLPPRLTVTVRGLRIQPNIPNALTRYYLAHVGHPFELRLDYETDARERRLTLKSFSASSPALGRFSLSAEIDGVDLSAPPEADRLAATAALGGVRIHFVNRQMIQNMLLMPLMTALPDAQEQPERAMATLKAAVLAGVMLDSSLDPASKQALDAFVAAFPDNKGALDVILAPKVPVPLVQIATAIQGDDRQKREVAAALNLSVRYIDLTWFVDLLDSL